MRSLLACTLAVVSFAVATPVFAQLPDEGPMPALSGAESWLNSKALTTRELRGKVVLVDFWTYSCVNCLRSLPYIKAWNAKYGPLGLVVIGVHAPEFDFEHDVINVKRAVQRLGITYPVVLDNGLKIWNAFHNEYWPAHYFIDRRGRIRYHHFGEGSYAESERVIRTLLADAGVAPAQLGADTTNRVAGVGTLAPSARKNVMSPETYTGYGRSDRFASPERVRRDTLATYTAPRVLTSNTWALVGPWRVKRASIVAGGRGARITFRFHARDLNLVLGPSVAGTPVKFRVTIDGQAPGNDAGVDVTANGLGVVTEHRMYQLIRQRGEVRDHTFEITFERAGVEAYAFTFG